MNSSDNFKEILKRKFSDFEELPPENDWEIFKGKFDLKKNRIRLYRRISVVSAIAVVAIIVSIIVLHRNNEQKNNIAQTLTKEVQLDKTQEIVPEKSIQRNSIKGNSQREFQDSKQQTEISKVVTSNIPYHISNQIRNQYSDSGIKKPSDVVRDEQQLKVPGESLTDKGNQITKTEKPVINQNPDDKLIDKESDKIEQVDNMVEKEDSVSDIPTNIQTDKAGLSSPVQGGDNSRLDVVNVITPNGDGINDKLVIKNLEQFGTCTLNIYTGWGEKIYSSSNYQNNWDGRYKGKLVEEGTYYYVLETKDGKVYKGAVNILK